MRRHSERPTRPRSWYSCASPSSRPGRRSSVLACGMSRPDSMIVVETRTSAPRAGTSMHLFLELALAHLAVARRAAAAPGTARRASPPPRRSSRRGCGGRTTWPPRAGSRSRACLTSSSSYSPTCVRIGRRPSGGVSIIEMSRSPASDMCSVRGIGVAVSDSTSTSSRSWRRSSFCATPKRCSSSTTTSPRFDGTTSLERTRCVPMSTSTLPYAKSARACFTSRRPAEPGDHLDA